jgi:hypothetical protein
MSDSNGTTTATVPPQEMPKPYRPEADTAKVYAAIERSLNEVVWEATHQACGFVSLASEHRGETTAVRYAHLVDAAECLEIALTHLGLLKSALAFRLRTEDADNIDTLTF